jgi:hypothetical protein
MSFEEIAALAIVIAAVVGFAFSVRWLFFPGGPQTLRPGSRHPGHDVRR